MRLRRLLGIVVAAVVAVGLLVVSAPAGASATASCQFATYGRQADLDCTLTGVTSPSNAVWSVNGSHVSYYDGYNYLSTACVEVSGQWTVQVSYTDTSGYATGWSAGTCHLSSAQSCHSEQVGRVFDIDCTLAGAASPPGSTWVVNGSYQSADDNLSQIYITCTATGMPWSSQVSYIDASGFATTSTLSGTC